MGRRGHIWQRGKGQWYMTEGGRQIPLGFDREDAEREFHRRKAGAEKARAAGLTLEALADLFADHIEREREPRTLEWYTMFLNSFLKYAGKGSPAPQVSPADVSAWLASHPSWGATTRSHGVSALKRLFAWGKREGLLAANPIKEIEKPRPKKRETWITDADAERMLDAARTTQAKNLLTALRETGCRPVEIYTLTADRVDLGAGTWLVLNKTRGMTGEKYRTIYLSPGMLEMSRKLVAANPSGHVFLNSRGEPWTKQGIVKLFLRVQDRTSLGGKATAYAFRHLYITDALERGIPPATVAELVGHKSLNMIMRVYSKLKHRTDHLREAAKMIRPPDINPNSA